MANEARRSELSSKFLEMGQALINEGTNTKDYTVTQSGTMMILISSLLEDEQDMFIFAELCSMFSAKKILDVQEGIDPLEQEMFAKILNDKKIKRETPPEAPKKRRGRRSKDSDDSETK